MVRFIKRLSHVFALCLHKSTIGPCVEHCCHVWAGAPGCFLDILDKLQKRICRVVLPSPGVLPEHLAHCRNVSILSAFYRQYYFGRCSFELAELAPIPHSHGRSIRF